MNKFGIAIILVAASVCLISAAPSKGGKSIKKQEQEQEQDFTVDHGFQGYHGKFPLGHGPVVSKPHHQQQHYGHQENSHYEPEHIVRNSGYFQGRSDQFDDEEFEAQAKYQNSKKLNQRHHDNQEEEFGGHYENYPEYEHEHEHHGHGKQHGLKHHGHKSHHENNKFGHHEQPEHFHSRHEQPEHFHGIKHHGHNKFGHHEQPEHFHGHHIHHEQPEHQGHKSHHGKRGFSGGFRPKQSQVSASDERESSKGSLNLQEDERERVHAEGVKFGNKKKAAGTIAGHVSKNTGEDTGIHQRQKFNTDKTIIQDKSTASNDLDVNHSVHNNKNAGAIAQGVIKSDTKFAKNRIDAERDIDRDLSVQTAQNREKEAIEAESFEF